MKKQVNVRLSPVYIEILKQLQDYYHAQGFAYSQADIIETALNLLDFQLLKTEGVMPGVDRVHGLKTSAINAKAK